MLWTRHETTQVETIVAIHSLTLSETGHLYYDLNHYPFTVSPYMPLYYSSSAALHRLGLPPLVAGRLLAASALIGVIVLSWLPLGLYTTDRFAPLAGAPLGGSTADLW